MNLEELEAFKLSDAVRFHDELNPALWIDDKLDPEVKDQLLLIAQDFVSYLGIKDLDVEDVRISGSNAAYSWTEHSDLDLHVLVDMSKLPNNEVYRELFQAKKTLYNDEHDITVHDVPIELYVQDINQPHVSLGEYSLLSDSWIRIPKKQRANFDQAATKAKFEKLSHLVELALKSRDLDRVEKVINIIKRYRQAGLDKAGEFSPENLSFKALRTQGGIQDLYDLRSLLRSEKLSIEEVSNEDYDPNGPPPGPEFKPTMPKGTVRVDVSDVYDWYKLGQHISNMKGLGKHDFGKGPPSTILSFGDEDLEHQYIKALAKTGLDTTDIDPVDPKQPKGMKRQKTDPTYNVNEGAVKNKLFVRQLSTENELIAHAKLFAKNLSLEGVPVTSKNRHTVVCSTIFAHNKKSLNESKHITSGKEAVQLLNRLDQFSKLPIKVGTKVAIINSQLQGDSLELWGFTTPKKISKIYRDPSDKSIKQFEFNNDPNDVWPRTENAEYNGHFLMYSAFFGDKKSADQALTMLMLQSSGDLEIRNHIVNEGASGYIPSNAEKNDPRYKTALTVDIHPNTMKKNAAKFGNKITRAGIPPQARADGKIK